MKKRSASGARTAGGAAHRQAVVIRFEETPT
jgi:hypothetical protein